VTLKVAVGDRIELEGRIRTVGLIAKANGKDFAVTAGDLGALGDHPLRDVGIPSAELLRALALPRKAGLPNDPRFTIGGIAAPEDCLKETVSWFHPKAGRVQGIVVGLHGFVRFRTGDEFVLVRDLVELQFTSSEAKGEQPPALSSEDAGGLVTTWDGRPIGLIVAVRTVSTFVAPLSGFLANRGLVHRTVERDAGIKMHDLGRQLVEQEAGLASQRVELMHEGSLGLEAFLEAA
jgi:hypothetical protein